MKNIIKIFLSDVRGLMKNFFALVIAIGLCIIPSLYAWFNIYSNWDPYANTSSVQIAVATEDKDYTLSDGSVVNMGDEVVDELKENDTIGWVFTDKDQALDGVYSGKYYAAVVIGEDFTSNMYESVTNGFQGSSITYYENEKKNAIAPKITDTAATTLQTSINEKFIEVVASTIFTETNQLSADLKNSDGIESFEDKLKEINASLQAYDGMIDTFIQGNEALTASVNSASDKIPGLSTKISDTAQDVTDTNASLTASQATLAGFNTDVQEALNQVQASLDAVATDLSNAGLGDKAKVTAESIAQTKNDTEALIAQLSTLQQTLEELSRQEAENKQQQLQDVTDEQKMALDESGEKSTESGIQIPDIQIPDIQIPDIQIPSDIQLSEETKQQIQAALDAIQSLQNGAGDITTALNTIQGAISDIKAEQGSDASKIANDVKTTIDSDAAGISSTLSGCKQSIENMKGVYSNNLVPEMSNVLDSMSQALTNVTNLLNNLNSTLGNMGLVFDGVETTMSGLDDSLVQIQAVIRSVSSELTDITDKLDAAGEDEKVDVLMDILEGDPETYGEFFAQPVSIETEPVYEVKNYGSAVAPFYTVLALWVGALLLVSLIKVKADPDKLDHPKHHELFFGRYLLFFVLGQVQAAVVVLGDIFLLKCQILYPGLFWFAASVTSFTFSMLIYALTIAFGDMGKAFAVVIVVIQIAGSSGTYPIEILPDFYQKVYIFFPFPYAINALRETVAGMYGSTFETALSELLVFAVAGLMIGLVIRIPFIRLNHFMEKRMEDTKMM